MHVMEIKPSDAHGNALQTFLSPLLEHVPMGSTQRRYRRRG
jgi:hypothetical protein